MQQTFQKAAVSRPSARSARVNIRAQAAATSTKLNTKRSEQVG